MRRDHASAPGRRSLLAAGLVAVAGPAIAQPAGWRPSRPVRLVVPSAAGGAPDLLCRALAEMLSGPLGQPVVVENRPGAAGTIGMAEVARAAPDGHTIGYANVVTLSINRSLLPSQPYDPDRDFAPVALLGFVQSALVVRPSLAATSVAELVALLRRAPGELRYASPGNGTTSHLGAEWFRSLTGTEMVHVPYRGSPQAITDLIGGQVDLMFDNLSSVAPHVRDGRVRALAVTGARRSPLFPDLPTVAEAGVAGFETTAWGGIVAPGATPASVLDALNAAVNRALADPRLRERYAALAFEIEGGSRGALFDLAARETPRWAEVIRRSGARVD